MWKLSLIFCNKLNGNLKFRGKSTSVVPGNAGRDL